MIEQNPRLLKGAVQVDEISCLTSIDEFSNYKTMIDLLTVEGYAIASRVLTPRPRIDGSRDRAYVVCALRPDSAGDNSNAVKLAEGALTGLQRNSSVHLTVDRLLIDFGFNREFWLERANQERKVVEGEHAGFNTKIHAKKYAAVGLQYPPLFPEWLREVRLHAGMTTREAECLHYYAAVDPIELIHTEESIVDLNASIGRGSYSSGIGIPCVLPKSRMWKRRRAEWLLAQNT